MRVHVSDEQIEKWNNQITLIRLTGACPHCDDEIDKDVFRNPNGDKIADWQCKGCGDQWIAPVADLPGTVDDSEYRIN